MDKSKRKKMNDLNQYFKVNLKLVFILIQINHFDMVDRIQ